MIDVKSRKSRSGTTRFYQGPNNVAANDKDEGTCRIIVSDRLGESSLQLQGQHPRKIRIGILSARRQPLELNKAIQRP